MNAIQSSLIFLFIITILIVGSSCQLTAQFDQNIEFVELTLKNGSTIRGIKQEDHPDYIRILENGTSIKILKLDIATFDQKLEPAVDLEKHQNTDNYSDSYLATQSAIGVPKGKVYARNTLLVWNQIQYGITDYLNVSGGIDNVFPFLFNTSPIVSFTPKLNTHNDKTNFAVGTTWLWVEEERISLKFATATYGDKSNNISLGVISGSAENDSDSELFFTLGVKSSLTHSLAFKGELVFVSGEGTLFGGSLDYFFSNGITLGLGIIGDSFNNNFPLASFTFPIYTKKSNLLAPK